LTSGVGAPIPPERCRDQAGKLGLDPVYVCTYAVVPDEVPEWTMAPLVVVAWNRSGTGGRILSARKATRRERRSYEEEP
jgi:hypothetical protein